MYLADTQTGQEVVQEHLARYIDQRNQQGIDPKIIVNELFALLGQKTVPADSPCAGIDGRNLCTMADILAAIGQAPLVAAKREAMMKAAQEPRPFGVSLTTLALVLGGTAAAWVFLFKSPPRRRRRS